MMELIDFSDCEIIPNQKFYSNNSKKLSVIYKGEAYLIKFPYEGLRGDDELFYIQQSYTEHTACLILEKLGFNVQKTLLGTYTCNSEKIPVVACKLFTSDKDILVDLAQILDLEPDTEEFDPAHDLPAFLYWMEKQGYVSPSLFKKHFWRLFVMDAYLGNRDRNFTNLGFLYHPSDDTYTIAPVFDCGDSLDPACTDEFMAKFMENSNNYDDYILDYPHSMFRIDGKPINYRNYFLSGANEDCMQAAHEIIPLLDEKIIFPLIDSLSEVDSRRREFYKLYLHRRKELIFASVF